jgi:hypothetical protein
MFSHWLKTRLPEVAFQVSAASEKWKFKDGGGCIQENWLCGAEEKGTMHRKSAKWEIPVNIFGFRSFGGPSQLIC